MCPYAKLHNASPSLKSKMLKYFSAWRPSGSSNPTNAICVVTGNATNANDPRQV
jgi:hypothetical protein